MAGTKAMGLKENAEPGEPRENEGAERGRSFALRRAYWVPASDSGGVGAPADEAAVEAGLNGLLLPRFEAARDWVWEVGGGCWL